MKITDIIKECLKKGIYITGVELVNGELAYDISGFSKSDYGRLYEENGKLYLETRYKQIDEIETFEDIANVAYEWNKNYSDREPFGWDVNWLPIFEEYGWVEMKDIKQTIIKPKR